MNGKLETYIPITIVHPIQQTNKKKTKKENYSFVAFEKKSCIDTRAGVKSAALEYTRGVHSKRTAH